MIRFGLVEWLVDQLVEEMEEMSDYALEYTLALLMNLCLRTKGKRACVKGWCDLCFGTERIRCVFKN